MLKRLTIAIALCMASGAAQPHSAAALTPPNPELVIYTYDSFAGEWGPGPKIKAEFEKTCRCTVRFIGLDTSLGILGRLQLEGADTKADIALGLDTASTHAARRTGLFDAHGMESARMQSLALPRGITWDDPDFVPFDWGYFAFVYDKSRLNNPPRSFRDIIESNHKIVIQDPRTSTPGTGLLLWVNAAYGDDAADTIWQGLAPRILTVTKGWSEAYNLFLAGEADMVLSYSTSPAYHRIAEGAENYAAAAFAEGHYMQIEVAGVLKSSKKKALARAFLAALIAPEMQAIIPTTNWMYPVAAETPLPAGFNKGFGDDEGAPVKSLLLPPEQVAAKRRQWIAAWLKALGQ